MFLVLGSAMLVLYDSPCPIRLEATPAGNYTARMIDTAKPRRRWLRYGLITLLVLAVVAGIGMCWVAQRMRESMRRTEAVEAIFKSGGGARFDFEVDESGKPLAKAREPGPAWLRYLMGQDLGANVIEAEVQTDEALEGVKDLPQLRRLHLFSKRITDVGLQHLEMVSQLETLYLEKTEVTDAGVKKLQKALPKCRVIR
jgi:hypothetical protein